MPGICNVGPENLTAQFQLAGMLAGAINGAVLSMLKINLVLRGIGRREKLGEARFEAQKEWLQSEESKADLALLEKHFDSLSVKDRRVASGIPARSGLAVAVPLTLAGLRDPQSRPAVIESIRYATIFGAQPEFRSGVSPEVARWALQDSSASGKIAIGILPKLDAELASQTLLSPVLLKGDPVKIFWILENFNEAGKSLPLPLVEKAIGISNKSGEPGSAAEYPAIQNWRQAVFALAYHRPADAISMIEKRVNRHPEEADLSSAIWLHASGLANLYSQLCDWADEPACFTLLPQAARIYFATSYFLSDCENGGIGQALSNSTGDHAALALNGFKLIGATQWVALLEEVFEFFGSEGLSRDRSTRRAQMERMEPSFTDREEALYEKMEKAEDTTVNDLSALWLLSRYAAQNADELRPILTKKCPRPN